VIGAEIIKRKLCLSDRETVSQIQENPYIQYKESLGIKQQMSSASLLRQRFAEDARALIDCVDDVAVEFELWSKVVFVGGRVAAYMVEMVVTRHSEQARR